MAQATRETLLDMAMGKTSGGRNNAGAWLAQQLRDNNYPDLDAETIMLEYAATVGGSGQGEYTEREAMATLKEAYSKPPREPWTTGSSTGSKPGMTRQQFRLHQAQRKLDGIPPKPPADPDPKSIETFKRVLSKCGKLIDTPAVAYLESRGIPADLATAAGTAYSPAWPFSKDNPDNPQKPVWVNAPAVVFSIRDENIPCNIIAAAGRRLDEWEGKNKITFGPKALGVFATAGALNADPVAITEAPIDALSLALAGLPAIALCGTNGIPPWVITCLAKRRSPCRSRTVYLAFDADPAGDTAAGKIGDMLSLVKAVRLRPEGGKDWNAVLTTKGRAFLQQSISAVLGPAAPSDCVIIDPDSQESQSKDEFKHSCMVCGRSVFLDPIPNTNKMEYHCTCGNTARILRMTFE